MLNLAHTHSHKTMAKVVLMVVLAHVFVVYCFADGFTQAPIISPTPIAANATKPTAVRIHAIPKVQHKTQTNAKRTQKQAFKKINTQSFEKPLPAAEPKHSEEPSFAEPETSMTMANTASNVENANKEPEMHHSLMASDSNEWDALLPPPIFLPQSNAQHLNNPQPEYPSLSRTLREQGRVLLDVHINIHGDVTDVRIRQSSGYPRLDDAALTAVKTWHYIPARQGKSAIALWHVQPISFVLN